MCVGFEAILVDGGRGCLPRGAVHFAMQMQQLSRLLLVLFTVKLQIRNHLTLLSAKNAERLLEGLRMEKFDPVRPDQRKSLGYLQSNVSEQCGGGSVWKW